VAFAILDLDKNGLVERDEVMLTAQVLPLTYAHSLSLSLCVSPPSCTHTLHVILWLVRFVTAHERDNGTPPLYMVRCVLVVLPPHLLTDAMQVRLGYDEESFGQVKSPFFPSLSLLLGHNERQGD
jgi:hypothetical protein